MFFFNGLQYAGVLKSDAICACIMSCSLHSDWFTSIQMIACAHPPLTPKKLGRGRLCVAVVNRVLSHMTFTWICGKDADWLVCGWGYVQDG